METLKKSLFIILNCLLYNLIRQHSMQFIKYLKFYKLLLVFVNCQKKKTFKNFKLSINLFLVRL